MFYVSNFDDDKWGITDTSDNVEEFYSEDELKKFPVDFLVRVLGLGAVILTNNGVVFKTTIRRTRKAVIDSTDNQEVLKQLSNCFSTTIFSKLWWHEPSKAFRTLGTIRMYGNDVGLVCKSHCYIINDKANNLKVEGYTLNNCIVQYRRQLGL